MFPFGWLSFSLLLPPPFFYLEHKLKAGAHVELFVCLWYLFQVEIFAILSNSRENERAFFATFICLCLQHLCNVVKFEQLGQFEFAKESKRKRAKLTTKRNSIYSTGPSAFHLKSLIQIKICMFVHLMKQYKIQITRTAHIECDHQISKSAVYTHEQNGWLVMRWARAFAFCRFSWCIIYSFSQFGSVFASDICCGKLWAKRTAPNKQATWIKVFIVYRYSSTFSVVILSRLSYYKCIELHTPQCIFERRQTNSICTKSKRIPKTQLHTHTYTYPFVFQVKRHFSLTQNEMRWPCQQIFQLRWANRCTAKEHT